jgi:hypothetical protein
VDSFNYCSNAYSDAIVSINIVVWMHVATVSLLILTSLPCYTDYVKKFAWFIPPAGVIQLVVCIVSYVLLGDVVTNSGCTSEGGLLNIGSLLPGCEWAKNSADLRVMESSLSGSLEYAVSLVTDLATYGIGASALKFVMDFKCK